jgi:hypothetical protein
MASLPLAAGLTAAPALAAKSGIKVKASPAISDAEAMERLRDPVTRARVRALVAGSSRPRLSTSSTLALLFPVAGARPGQSLIAGTPGGQTGMGASSPSSAKAGRETIRTSATSKVRTFKGISARSGKGPRLPPRAQVGRYGLGSIRPAVNLSREA